MKHRILLVDAERRSVRVLSVALRSAGYGVRIAGNGLQALDKIEAAIPDVIVSDSQLPKLDGYGLVEKVKAHPETENIPILLLTSRGTSEDRERGRSLGVSDYLPKPVFVRELLACIGLLIARSARAKMAASITTTRTGRFSGSTRDVSVVDLLQTFELLRESGVARLLRGTEAAEIYFRDGRAVDARLGRLRGEQAIYAALLWSEAALDVEFRSVKKEDVIDRSVGTLLVEGMRRVDAWGHIYEQLRPLTSAVETDQARLLEQIASRLSDGKALSAERGNALLQGLGDSAVVATNSSLVSQRAAIDEDEDEGEDNEDEEFDENANDRDDDDRDQDDEDDGDRDAEGHDARSEAIHEPARSTEAPEPVVPLAAAPPAPIYEGATITLRAPAPSRGQAAAASPIEPGHPAPAVRTAAQAQAPFVGAETPAAAPSVRTEAPGHANGHTPASQTNGHAGLARNASGATQEIAFRPAAPMATAPPVDLVRESHDIKNGEDSLALARPSAARERAVIGKPVVTIPAVTAEKLAAPVARTERLAAVAPDAAKLGAGTLDATRLGVGARDVTREKAPLSELGPTLRPTNGVKSTISAASSLPSTPPWTHEVDAENEPAADLDGPIPGVSPAFGRTGRILVGAGVALALIIGVVTGLRPSGSHARTADEARKAEAVTAAAAAARAEAPPTPVATAPTEAVAAPPATPDPSAAIAAIETPAPAPNAGTPTAGPAGEPMAAGPPTDPSPPAGGEFHPAHHSPLVAQAEQALMKGATDRAIVLAGQAVAATPTDADAWLALGAAHRAAGDESAARSDYRSCIVQAHSEGVNHCRVLAEH
ncbi:MAG TPA: response regulator [Polyangiaceae bacterium]|jgi:DNA-binding response OmpR family regulator|nr:response regulator [Polyangiaceae bacterium]